jgi:hypothetical protein
MPRLLVCVLPAEFVRRVAEPAYDDLLASRLERGRPAVGLLAVAGFVVECLWAAFSGPVFRPRRPRILAAALVATVILLVVVRERLAYSAGDSAHPPSVKSERVR